MLLRLFISNKQSLFFILPLSAVILWTRSFFITGIFELNPAYELMPFYKVLTNLIGIETLVAKIFSLLILIINAFLLSHINTRFLFIRVRTQLPAFIFILLSGTYTQIHLLHPAVPASFFVILAIDKIMQTYKGEGDSYKIFDASLLISVASLFYIQALGLTLILWAGLVILRPFYWREWAYSVLGIILPYIFVFAFSFVFKNGYTINVQHAFAEPFSLNGFKFTLIGKISFYYILFLIVISSIFMIRVYGTKKIHSRNYFKFFLWIFIIVALMLFFVTSISIEIFVIFSIPLAYLLSHFFINSRKERLKKLIFYSLVILILLNQFV